ncbi:unnamed protein product [Mytilus coruscus]|uniref:Uncharacterized protein n=1 Tax=Mytilus coruscus TaxID=42192 RepID=A0A6J8EZN0_MYTCO|nr:unnamed protein product [Mytilus coruscus]
MTTKTSNHNFIRLQELQIVARSALRDTLRNRHASYMFDSVLKAHENNLKKILLCSDLQKLFPDSGQYTGDFDEFDISCLYKLLREIEPDDSDNCMSAHIERLRIFRNTLAHSKDQALNDEEFKKEWSKLHKSIVELGGQKYHNVVREKLNSTDGNSNMSEIINDILYSKEKKLEQFVETEISKTILQQLKEHQIVIIRGGPKSGKTLTAFYAAFQLRKLMTIAYIQPLKQKI